MSGCRCCGVDDLCATCPNCHPSWAKALGVSGAPDDAVRDFWAASEPGPPILSRESRALLDKGLTEIRAHNAAVDACQRRLRDMAEDPRCCFSAHEAKVIRDAAHTLEGLRK